jgi:hypothetical protein
MRSIPPPPVLLLLPLLLLLVGDEPPPPEPSPSMTATPPQALEPSARSASHQEDLAHRATTGRIIPIA